MASNLPIYRAPSITKLSKKNISSSVFRGASVVSASPKLQRSSFSFAKSKNNINVESLGSQENIANTLSETNRILVEIQKQLSLDFAMRIAEEKAVVKKIKATESKKRFSAKEAAVESAKKIGSTLNNTFDKVIAPAKSIFSKIVEFFQLILTGIALNVAFKWLQDPSNRAKLDSVFQFIGDHWKEILAVFIGVKVLGVLYQIYTAAKLIKALIDRIKGGGKTPAPPINQPPKLPPKPKIPVKSIPPTRAPQARPPLSSPLLGANGKPLNIDPLSRYKGAGSVPGRAPSIPKPGQGITSKPGGSPSALGTGALGNIFKVLRVIGLGFLIAELKSDADRGDYKAIAVKLSAYGLGWLATGLVAAGGTAFGIGTAPTGAGAVAGFALAASSMGIGYGVDTGIRRMFGYKDGGTISANGGMTVPGKGCGQVDSVKAMLAPGEEVICTESANLFRPVLKDINENAGRLWVLFSQAVKKLISVTDYQTEVSKQFQKTIETFDKYLKDEILKKKISKKGPGGGGGGPIPMSARSKSVSATPRTYNYNLISQGDSSGGMTFLPMNLPPIRSKPPEIPTPSNQATDVPIISPVNMANPYMHLTPELYGIFV